MIRRGYVRLRRASTWWVLTGLAILAWAVFSPSALDEKNPGYGHRGEVVILGKMNSHSCGENPEEGMAIEIQKVLSDPDRILRQPGRVSGPFPKAYVLITCPEAIEKVIRRFELGDIFRVRFKLILIPISGSDQFRIDSISIDG